MKLFGPPSATWETVQANLDDKGARLIFMTDIMPAIWHAATHYYVDPVGAIAQSYKETGGGAFTGAIDSRWFNTCGLKVRNQTIDPALAGDQPLAHAMFPNWVTGAFAHIQHVRAYGSWDLPAGELLVDPRYVWVMGKHKCTEWYDLGGKWAPSLSYGHNIEEIMFELSS